MPPSDLSGRQKAAMLLVSLGPDISSQIFKHLRDDDIEALTLEIANLRKIPPYDRDRVFVEFNQIIMAQEYIATGGIDYARDLLEKALGSQRAIEIINRLTTSLQIRPFEFVRKTDPTQLYNLLQNEHAQTIALILVYLHPEQASIILASLPSDRQVDVARRMALMDRTSPEIIKEVERVLERKLSSVVTHDFTTAGGIDSVVEILNRVDRGTERTIIEHLEVDDPGLAEEIKKRMLVFEDIINLDDRSIQQVLREVDMNRDLPLALKGASEEVRGKISKNVSKRAADTLKENMDFLGPVRVRDVEEAQQKIVNIIRKLEEAGEIVVARGGGDELIV